MNPTLREKIQKLSVGDKIYYIKVGLAFTAGTICAVLDITNYPGFIIAGFFLFVPFLLVKINLLVFEMERSELKGNKQIFKETVLKNGFFTFLFIFMVVWTIMWNVISETAEQLS